MPIFHITSPEGDQYEIEGPEGSTEEQALAQVQAQHQPGPTDIAHHFGSGKSFDTGPNGEQVPTGSVAAHALQSPLSDSPLENFAAGAGKSVYDTGRGISQLVGGQTAKDTDDQRALDAPLMHSGAGIAGDIAGSVAQMALPGAGVAKGFQTARAAPGIARAIAPFAAAVAPELGGAGMGAIAPVGSDETRTGNAGIGALTGLAGAGVGEQAQSLLRSGPSAIPQATRDAYALAKSHGIDLTVPQMGGKFAKYYSSLVDALPFSGAEAKAAEQRAQVNNAIGRQAGIPNAQGAVTPDKLDAAQDAVGSTIGNIAERNTAVPTAADTQKLLDVLARTRANSTPEITSAVESKLKQIFAHVDPVTGEIPGTAWREANTSLQRQIRSTTDGDLKHYLGQVQNTFHDMMTNNMSPADLAPWQEARGQYRNLMSIAPLVEKGGNEGINPTLLRQRLIAAKNNRGTLSDIADLGQEQLKDRVPNSGTSQRNMIASMVGLGGAGTYGALEHPMSTALTGAAIVGNNLVNRALKSNLAAKYYVSRMPSAAAAPINRATASIAPGLAIPTISALDTPDNPQEARTKMALKYLTGTPQMTAAGDTPQAP
jgi:hypothetical protein